MTNIENNFIVKYTVCIQHGRIKIIEAYSASFAENKIF